MNIQLQDIPYKPTGSYTRLTPQAWVRMWELLCNKTPLTGTFNPREILQAAGFNKDQIGEFLKWNASHGKDHRIEQVSRKEWHWVFE